MVEVVEKDWVGVGFGAQEWHDPFGYEGGSIVVLSRYL